MATATELTLTLGRTVYSGDPDSDERLQAREARVSVTWSLGEDEQDLTLTTSALAEEAERALAQMVQPREAAPYENPVPSALQKQGMNGQGANGRSATAANSSSVGNSSTGNGSNGNPTHSHPGNGNGYGNGRGHQANSKQAGPEVGSGRAATASPETTSEEATTPRYGDYIPPRAGNGHSGSTGSATNAGGAATSAGSAAQSQSPSPASARAPSVARTQSAATQSVAKAQAITRAQCLAVHSHCTRRGIAQWELLRLVAEHFGKSNLEDLDKNQGGELLNMLQQAEHEQKSGNSEYAN